MEVQRNTENVLNLNVDSTLALIGGYHFAVIYSQKILLNIMLKIDTCSTFFHSIYRNVHFDHALYVSKISRSRNILY